MQLPKFAASGTAEARFPSELPAHSHGNPVSKNLELHGHTHPTSSPVTLLVSYHQVRGRGRSLAVQHGRDAGIATWELQRRAPSSEPPSRSPGNPGQQNPAGDGRKGRPSHPVTCRIPYRRRGIPRSTTRAGTRSSARRAVSPNSQRAGRRTDHGANPSPAREGGSSAVDPSSKAPLPETARQRRPISHREPTSRGKWAPSAAFARAASLALRVASRKWGGQGSQLPQAATSALDGAVRRSIVATERRMRRRTML